MAKEYKVNEATLLITRTSIARRRAEQTRLDMTILPDATNSIAPKDLAAKIVADASSGYLQNVTGVKLMRITVETRRPTYSPSTATPTKMFADFQDLSGQEKGILAGASLGGILIIGLPPLLDCSLASAS
jgi:hypothetical protein